MQVWSLTLAVGSAGARGEEREGGEAVTLQWRQGRRRHTARSGPSDCASRVHSERLFLLRFVLHHHSSLSGNPSPVVVLTAKDTLAIATSLGYTCTV